MKKIIIVAVLFLIVSVGTAFADYTIELKNESGVVLKTYTVTSAQVLHLKKVHERTLKTVLNQFEEAILDLIREAEESNLAAADTLTRQARIDAAKD